MEGSDNLIRDSKLSSSIANAGGVFIVDTSCTNCSLINSNVTVFGSNAYGLYIGTEQPSELSGNLSIIDSVIRSVNSYDYAFVAGLGATNHINVNATNVSSDYETYWVYGMEDSARLFMNYNIDSYINITNGTNAVGATFTGRDKNNNLIFSDTTNASGNAARKTVISMIKSITQNTTFSLYNMTASLAGAVSVSNTTVNVTRNLMINLQIDRGANFTDCATNKCIFIKNKAGDNKAAFDSLGNVDLEGNVYMNGAGTATGNDFLIKNKAGTTKAWVDNVNGTLMIAGGVTQKQGTYCTPPANSWIVRSKAGNCVAYIDTSGNLWLRGTLGTASPI